MFMVQAFFIVGRPSALLGAMPDQKTRIQKLSCSPSQRSCARADPASRHFKPRLHRHVRESAVTVASADPLLYRRQALIKTGLGMRGDEIVQVRY